MAKKTVAKKKVAPTKAAKASKKAPAKGAAKAVKKAPAKVVKPAAKKAASKPPVKVKAAVKPSVVSKTSAKANTSNLKKSAPKTMSAKGKKPEVEEKTAPAKAQTVISMMEDPSGGEDAAKAEKVSKVKPVKIERGNVADEKAKWAELFKKYGKDKAIIYKMSDTFTPMIPVQHKVLGWGFVLTNENDRLEVLFETGIRMLISNYKV